MGAQFVTDGLFFLGLRPFADEVRELGVAAADVAARVVDDVLLPEELAVHVIDGDGLLNEADRCAAGVHIVDRRLFRRWFRRRGRHLRTLPWLEIVDLLDRTIPVGVGKKTRHASEIHDGEAELALILAHTGTAADDLLKLRHGVDVLIEHDQLRHLTVGAGRQELGGGRDDRILRGDGDEVIELALSVVVRAGDAHHVVRVLLHHVLVHLNERNPHAFGSVLGSTEHDGLLHSPIVLQVLRDLEGDFVDTVSEDDVVIVVGVVVDAVLDLAAIVVALALERTPADADVQRHAEHTERREEAIVDAGLQAVFIDRFSEVIDI